MAEKDNQNTAVSESVHLLSNSLKVHSTYGLMQKYLAEISPTSHIKKKKGERKKEKIPKCSKPTEDHSVKFCCHWVEGQ